MSKAPKTPYGCGAQCGRKYGSKAGFAIRVVLDMRVSVCPICKAAIDAAKEKTK